MASLGLLRLGRVTAAVGTMRALSFSRRGKVMTGFVTLYPPHVTNNTIRRFFIKYINFLYGYVKHYMLNKIFVT